jgi:hypothetical protein
MGPRPDEPAESFPCCYCSPFYNLSASISGRLVLFPDNNGEYVTLNIPLAVACLPVLSSTSWKKMGRTSTIDSDPTVLFNQDCGSGSSVLAQSGFGYGSRSTKKLNSNPMRIRIHNRNFEDKFFSKLLKYRTKI